MIPYFILPIAFIIDLILGTPRWFPHPVKAIAFLCYKLELATRKIFKPFFAGLLVWFILVAVTIIFSACALQIFQYISPLLYLIGSILLVWMSMAPKDLAIHALAVYKALKIKDIPLAQNKVSMIVGRDTKNLSEDAIIRATVETIAESFVDGVLSPLFWAFLCGPLGAITYRTINTLDSIIGHKNERYEQFGKVAARADDIANIIPSRLSLGIITIASIFTLKNPFNTLKIGFRDRYKHQSPNSAWSEASWAGALGLKIGGPLLYDGILVDKPWIGDKKHDESIKDIINAIILMYSSTILSILIFSFILYKLVLF